MKQLLEDLKSDSVGRLCVVFGTTFGSMAIFSAIGSAVFDRPGGMIGAVFGLILGFWIGNRANK